MVVIFGSRFFIEFIKIPQESLEPILNINMGQWLSIAVVVLGVYFMFYNNQKVSNEKPVEKYNAE